MKDRVAVLRAERYQVDEIAQILGRALNLLDLALPRNSSVLLKPNVIAQNTPRQCTTTHPAVVEAVCALLADRGNRISIGDSSAFYQGGHTERAFVTSGIAGVAKRFGAELIAFEKGPLKLVKNEGKSGLKEILLSAAADEADWIINLPKLKTHAFFRMSGAVKNLFGFVPGGAKYEYHFLGGTGRDAFAEKLADIWLAVRPELSIMDAIRGLEGFGPAATGTPIQKGLLLVSENPWPLDWIAARCIGMQPETLPGCGIGLERGYMMSPERIEITGDFSGILPVSVWKSAPSGEEKPKESNGFYRLVAVHPALRANRCTACGKCLEACPLGAIGWENAAPKPNMHLSCCSQPAREPGAWKADFAQVGPGPIRLPAIDLGRCLRCHHCVYVCAEKALYLKGDSPFNLPARALRKLLRL